MVQRQQIHEYLDNYLAISDVEDTCVNGLQVEGSEDVRTLGVAVDAGLSIFDQAIAERVDFLITHHGHFWHSANPSLTGWKKKRIELLLENDISLYAAHLPLDRHPEVGNNALLLKLLGTDAHKEFFPHAGALIGKIGRLPSPTPLGAITEQLENQLNTQCLPVGDPETAITTVAAVSGGGSYGAFYSALEAGVDLLLTGDTIEIYHSARDSGLNVIFAGHHATETLGIRSLGRHLAKKFDLPVKELRHPTGL